MKIRISQMEEGHHTFVESENPQAIGLEDESRFSRDVDVRVEVDKRGKNYYIQQIVHTKARFECDRCLEPFVKDLDAEYRVVYTSDTEFLELDEDIRYVAPEQSEIDITEDIRETVLLAIPIKLLCKHDCKGLCPHCGANLNVESCTCAEEMIDPRWEALKKLLR